jgi:hypothetical protein
MERQAQVTARELRQDKKISKTKAEAAEAAIAHENNWLLGDYKLRNLRYPWRLDHYKQERGYSPSRDPNFNGEHKEQKYAMSLDENPPPCTTEDEYCAWASRTYPDKCLGKILRIVR